MLFHAGCTICDVFFSFVQTNASVSGHAYRSLAIS
jgi:hypothetical protein